MKKAVVILSVISALLLILTVGFGVLYVSEQDTDEDFSFMYVDAAQGMLGMIDHDAAFADYRDGGVLFLDTSGITQTPTRYLEEMIVPYAEKYDLEVVACTREQAAQKGLIQLADEDSGTSSKALDCVWLSVSDREAEDGNVHAFVCLYAADRAAYSHELRLSCEDGHWIAETIGGGIS